MATRWVQEGYWGRYFLRLSEDGQFQFQIPRGGGVWRVIQLDLMPDDGGTFGLPEPVRKIVGDLSDREKVLHSLDLLSTVHDDDHEAEEDR